MPVNGITKDDRDVSDDPSPLLRDPLITEAINMFNALSRNQTGLGAYEEGLVTD
jgi:hypothetical protein